MRIDFEQWLKDNRPAAQPWIERLLAGAAAGTATAAVWFSVVLMAGLGLPAGEPPAMARAPLGTYFLPAVPSASQQTARAASALPTVTVVGRRTPAAGPAAVPATSFTELPTEAAGADASIVRVAGDHRQQ